VAKDLLEISASQASFFGSRILVKVFSDVLMD